MAFWTDVAAIVAGGLILGVIAAKVSGAFDKQIWEYGEFAPGQ